MKLDIRVKYIPWETLHVCKTLTLLANFSINTTYKQPICCFLDLCHKFSENLDMIGKMALIFVFSRRKANWMLKIYSWEFFYRPVLFKHFRTAQVAIQANYANFLIRNKPAKTIGYSNCILWYVFLFLLNRVLEENILNGICS